MSKYIIQGGVSLSGSIDIKGSKNEAYQVICAALLTTEDVILNNIPDILDINKILNTIEILGVKVLKLEHGKFLINASNLDKDQLNSPKFLKYASTIRGTAMLLAPFLARFGYIKIPKPGGDKIGRRPIDVHLRAFKQLGAKIKYDQKKSIYEVSILKIKNNYIVLEEASVTGTANILMAVSALDSTTFIYNAASEPYISQLGKMLSSMGANVEGAGTNKIKVQGNSKLKGTEHTIMPDIMEIGSFIGLAASSQSDIILKNIPSKEILFPIINNFEKLGIKINYDSNQLHIPAMERYTIKKALDGGIIHISDNIWPGFPADLISIALVTAIQCKGTVLLRQRMFESRLFFVDLLIEMGAQIILCDPHRAVVIGLDHTCKLTPTNMKSPDIRAGLAMLIAALTAKGTSIISNCEQIDRGYENIDGRLNSIGAKIEKID